MSGVLISMLARVSFAYFRTLTDSEYDWPSPIKFRHNIFYLHSPKLSADCIDVSRIT